MGNLPLISVICPVYNAEKYIDNMLDSVLSQDYKNIELVIVDDVSTDKTFEKILSRAQKDSRINLIENDENTGPGPAKNKAIKASNGDFICFIDGDDWIEQGMFSSMINKQAENDSDVVVVGYFQDYLDENNKLKYSVTVLPPEIKNNCSTAEVFALLDAQKIFSFCWTKMFRASIIRDNNIKFPPLMHSEDFFFNIYILPYIKSTADVQKAFYHYIKPQHQTLTTGDYIDGFYELSNKRYEACKAYCESQNAFDGNIRSLISNTHLKHLSICLVYNCSEKSKMKHKDRISFAKKILDDVNTKEAIEYCSPVSKSSKLLNTFFKMRNAKLLVAFSRMLWLAKYKFSFIFDKLK